MADGASADAYLLDGASDTAPPGGWALHMEEAGSFVPRSGSAAYASKSYWDWRFATESEKEWLAGYRDVRDLIRRYVARDAAVLLVGCGNSRLAQDMADDGYTCVTASDYSATVVDAMRARAAATHAGVRWVTADMLALRDAFPAASFDAVIDKAAMDAVLADGGDAWDPPAYLLAAGAAVSAGVAAVLRPGGVFLQLSFSQPHFRRQFIVAGGALEVAAVHKVDTGLGYHFFVARHMGATVAAPGAVALRVTDG